MEMQIYYTRTHINLSLTYIARCVSSGINTMRATTPKPPTLAAEYYFRVLCFVAASAPQEIRHGVVVAKRVTFRRATEWCLTHSLAVCLRLK